MQNKLGRAFQWVRSITCYLWSDNSKALSVDSSRKNLIVSQAVLSHGIVRFFLSQEWNEIN